MFQFDSEYDKIIGNKEITNVYLQYTIIFLEKYFKYITDVETGTF